MAKAAAGKTGKYKHQQIRPTDVTVPSVSTVEEDNEREAGQFAKFNQNSELKDMLLKTKRAQLLHYVRKKPAEIATTLMKIRERLNSTTPTPVEEPIVIKSSARTRRRRVAERSQETETPRVTRRSRRAKLNIVPSLIKSAGVDMTRDLDAVSSPVDPVEAAMVATAIVESLRDDNK